MLTFLIPLDTTVMDVNIVNPCDESLGEAKGSKCGMRGNEKVVFIKGQDLNTAAIAEQCANSFLVDVPGINGTSSNPSGHAGASVSTQHPAASTSGSHHHHHKPPGGGRVKTETVYTNIKTVTVTTTVTEAEPTHTGSGTEAQNLSAATTSSGTPSVSPFIKANQVRHEPHAKGSRFHH